MKNHKITKNCSIVLKHRSLKSFWFTKEFWDENEKISEELLKVYDEIHKNYCSAMGAAEELQNNNDLKLKLIKTLKPFYDLGVKFQNGMTNKRYTSFKQIKDYILNYK